MVELWLTVLLTFALLLGLVLIYLLCCKCIIIDSYTGSQEARLRRIREELDEEERQRQLIMDYIDLRNALLNYKYRYRVPKPEIEEIEEDKEHVIIVNPGDAKICIGKVITD